MSANATLMCSRCSHSPVCKNQSMFRQFQTEINECVRYLDVVGGNIVKPDVTLGRSVDQVEKIIMKECGLSVEIKCQHFSRREEEY